MPLASVATYIAKNRGLPVEAVEVRDDGQGAYIASWPDNDPPTAAEIEEATPLVVADLNARAQIAALEAQMTLRRIREAIVSGSGWMEGVEAQIEQLRGDLLP